MILSNSMNGLDTCLANNPDPEPETEEKEKENSEEEFSELSLAQIENICAHMEGYW